MCSVPGSAGFRGLAEEVEKPGNNLETLATHLVKSGAHRLMGN